MELDENAALERSDAAERGDERLERTEETEVALNRKAPRKFARRFAYLLRSVSQRGATNRAQILRVRRERTQQLA